MTLKEHYDAGRERGLKDGERLRTLFKAAATLFVVSMLALALTVVGGEVVCYLMRAAK